MKYHNQPNYNQNNNGLDVLAGITFLVAIFNTVLGLSNLDKNKEGIKAQKEIKDNQKQLENKVEQIENKIDKLLRDK
jgi:peptidoglycan hydrolase CwlO-like protein